MASNKGSKKKQKKQPAGAPQWMVTYSDLVTLLLTFFVLLLSMASLDQLKFNQAIVSLKNAFGVIGAIEQRRIAPPAVIEIPPVEDDLLQRVYNRIMTKFNRLRIDEDITLVKDRGAVVLRVNNSILFGPGEYEVKPEAHDVLKRVADLIRPLPLQLRIAGHSDSTPFTKKDTSNWDLSMMRSISVLKFFAHEKLYPVDRMSATAFGSQRPVAPNDSQVNRALNRRVDFILESIGGYSEELPYLIDARDQLPF